MLFQFHPKISHENVYWKGLMIIFHSYITVEVQTNFVESWDGNPQIPKVGRAKRRPKNATNHGGLMFVFAASFSGMKTPLKNPIGYIYIYNYI